MSRNTMSRNTLNDLNLQRWVQNYERKHHLERTNNQGLPSMRAPINGNNHNKRNLNAMVEYIFYNFSKEHMKRKENKKKALLKEADQELTRRLLKESNNHRNAHNNPMNKRCVSTRARNPTTYLTYDTRGVPRNGTARRDNTSAKTKWAYANGRWARTH